MKLKYSSGYVIFKKVLLLDTLFIDEEGNMQPRTLLLAMTTVFLAQN